MGPHLLIEPSQLPTSQVCYTFTVTPNTSPGSPACPTAATAAALVTYMTAVQPPLVYSVVAAPACSVKVCAPGSLDTNEVCAALSTDAANIVSCCSRVLATWGLQLCVNSRKSIQY